MVSVVESVYATRPTELEAKVFAESKNDAARSTGESVRFGVLHIREWHGDPVRTVNPWLVIARRVR